MYIYQDEKRRKDKAQEIVKISGVLSAEDEAVMFPAGQFVSVEGEVESWLALVNKVLHTSY